MDKNDESTSETLDCPICGKNFPSTTIESHVNRCIFLNSTNGEDKPKESKRSFGVFSQTNRSPTVESKKFKKLSTITKSPSTTVTSDTAKAAFLYSKSEFGQSNSTKSDNEHRSETSTDLEKGETDTNNANKSMPLAEKVRPTNIDEYIGQTHVMGKDAILRKILDKDETPSMILWGPPGVGKVNNVNTQISINNKNYF